MISHKRYENARPRRAFSYPTIDTSTQHARATGAGVLYSPPYPHSPTPRTPPTAYTIVVSIVSIHVSHNHISMSTSITRLFHTLLLAALMLPLFTFAQVSENPEGTSLGNTDCFEHYSFGSVQVDLYTTIEQTVPGMALPFKGLLKNENSYPIVNGSVYVKIFKHLEESDTNIVNSGYPLVAFFEAGNNIAIPANSDKEFSFDWQVPQNLSGGDYEAAFFFVTNNSYELNGLPFTDDVTGNKTLFSITSETDSQVVFDKYSTALNKKPYYHAKFPPEFELATPVELTTVVINPSNETKVVALEWRLYNWSSLRETSLMDVKGETLTLKPLEKRIVSYVASEYRGSVSHLIAILKDGDATSILNPRFVRNSIEEVKLNFPSTETFPLRAGQEASIFTCAHGTNFKVPMNTDNSITLTLRDRDGAEIHSYTHTGDIGPNMMAVADTFLPKKDYSFFTLTATLSHKGTVVEEVSQTYDCAVLGPDTCLEENESSTSSTGTQSQSSPLIIAVSFLFTLLLIGVYLVMKKHPKSFKTSNSESL